MIYLKRFSLFLLSVIFLPFFLSFLLSLNLYKTVLNPDFYDSEIVAISYSDFSRFVFSKLSVDVPEVKNFVLPVEFQDMFVSAFPQDLTLQSWKFFVKDLRNVSFSLKDGFAGLDFDLSFSRDGFDVLTKQISSTLIARLPICVLDEDGEVITTDEFCLKSDVSASFYEEQLSKKIDGVFSNLLPASINLMKIEPVNNSSTLLNDFSFSRLFWIFSLVIGLFFVLLLLLVWGNWQFASIYLGSYFVVLGLTIFALRQIVISRITDFLNGSENFKNWNDLLTGIVSRSLSNLNIYLVLLFLAGLILFLTGIYWRRQERL